ncbi:hypothetical protein [Bifidobacterium vansinderenii]|uniref:Teichoic acid transporter n=1 Tax=Bifidobacterium vansinderenii TaxID=1984871 RepID=A0A229VWW6_9BIFI|nr:hypothetical protein [Bifidobacterium vansinderenii]OXN00115.1 teichoic acid transporter [Bifidobacterium vansinderenii]
MATEQQSTAQQSADSMETDPATTNSPTTDPATTDPDTQIGPGHRPVKRTDPRASHPRALSMAERERKEWHKGRWIVFIVSLLVAIIVPYWVGRYMAMNGTQTVVDAISPIDPRGAALISWVVTSMTFMTLGMAVMETRKVIWRVLFILSLAVEQLIAGVCLLRFNFWYSTYVVYGNASPPINAANLGILASAIGLAVFAVLYVGLLVLIRKDSPLNVLTRSWSALAIFFVIELAALAVVMFGGLVTAV